MIRLERATLADVPSIEALLVETGLPLEGAAEAFCRGVIAWADDGRLLGIAAVERYGQAGLLRSVAVREDARGAGLGRALVQAAQDVARAEGITTLYLLTETAAPWFARLGYATVARTDVPPAVAGSVEFVVACPASAVTMVRPL